MKYVPFNPEKLTGEQQTWWKNWSRRAAEATERLLEQNRNGQHFDFQKDIWKDLKNWLLENVFHGKCAYCESKVTDTENGDADHYRPKGQVSILSNEKHTKVEIDGRIHPGYFWLAYNWQNLLPSCKLCNTAYKKDLFPIENQHVFDPQECFTCEELDKQESPLLLNPYRCGKYSPRHHLQFGPHGRITARNGSKHGMASIKTYGLRRQSLKESRRKAQETAWYVYKGKVKTESDADAYLSELMDGSNEYSIAIADYLRIRLEEEIKKAKDDIQILDLVE